MAQKAICLLNSVLIEKPATKFLCFKKNSQRQSCGA